MNENIGKPVELKSSQTKAIIQSLINEVAKNEVSSGIDGILPVQYDNKNKITRDAMLEMMARVKLLALNESEIRSSSNINGIQPVVNEVVASNDGHFSIVQQDTNGQNVLRSKTKELEEILQNLISSGQLTDLISTIESSGIFNFFADNTMLELYPAAMTPFPLSHRYYQIYEINTDPAADKEFVAGIPYTDVNGQLQYIYKQEMERRPLNTDTSERFMFMTQAKLIKPLVEGKLYMVDFINEYDIVIGRHAFQCRLADTINNNYAPSDLVTGLRLTSNRSVSADVPTIRLWVGEDIDLVLQYQVFLLYGNGNNMSDRPIIDDDRLTITFEPDPIDTSRPTSENQLNQRMILEYAKNPDNSGNQVNNLVQPIRIIVEDDLNQNRIQALIPFVFISGDPLTSDARITVRIFGIYLDVNNQLFMQDITRSRVINPIGQSGSYNFVFNEIRRVFESSRLGIPTETVVVQVQEGTNTTLRSFTFRLNTQIALMDNVTVDGDINRIEYRAINNMMRFPNTSQLQLTNSNILNQNNFGVTEDMIPTHFTIYDYRDFARTGVYCRDISLNLFAGFNIVIPNGSQIGSNSNTFFPVMVEFTRNRSDTNGNLLERQVTSGRLYYVRVGNW